MEATRTETKMTEPTDNRYKPRPQHVKDAIGAATRAWYNDPATAELRAAKNAKQSEASRHMWADPEFKARTLAKIHGNPNRGANISKAHKALNADPEYRAKLKRWAGKPVTIDGTTYTNPKHAKEVIGIKPYRAWMNREGRALFNRPFEEEPVMEFMTVVAPRRIEFSDDYVDHTRTPDDRS